MQSLALTKDQEAKFAKLGISRVSELALLIPSSYEDLSLREKLTPNTYGVIDATIESVYRAPNTIQITFFAHNFGHSLQGVLFRPKPYMMHQFQVGMREYFYGLIDCKGGSCSISMPRKVTKVGGIVSKYKTALRTDVMARLVESLLNLQNLQQEGIKLNIAQEILTLHFPDPNTALLKETSSKQKDALKYLELFNYMKHLAAKRRYFDAMRLDLSDYRPWAKTLPFTLTAQQQKAIEEIELDFSKDVAARRMVVGDVGSGKTMVILASAIMNTKGCSILMAPTTILANQLYEEAQKHTPKLRSILVTNKTKKQDLSGYDFIIGTHALLYRELPSASLVMVDEQHRFGTQQRNMLEKLVSEGQKKPHFLQFSATPIPRTQAMIESAHIDVSLITSTPFTKNIASKVIGKKDFRMLLEHIKTELDQKHQVLLVYPLVEQSDMLEYQSIDEARGYWEKNFERVYVTHGKDKAKEETLLEFRKKGEILIATTVVEVGISLPRLSTVVIVGAERLGLSTLHQLRGRVSRTGLQGYCYLYTNKESSERLERFVETQSGFDIALLDLQYRKSGDLLRGSHQSGSQFRWVDMAEDKEIIAEVKSDLGL